jgi:SAM-dependent methyltransferase
MSFDELHRLSELSDMPVRSRAQEGEFRMLSWRTDFNEPDGCRALEEMVESELTINFSLNRSLTSETFLEDESLRMRCGTSRVPTMLIHGADDPRPPAGAALLAEWIPASRFEVIPGAGHLPWVEQPDRVRRSLTSFLRAATSTDTRRLLEVQRAYYDERAPDYMDPSKPSDRKGGGWLPESLGSSLIDEFAPTGDVLELACGSGACTREIVRHVSSLTAVDGSARMIERSRWTTSANIDGVPVARRTLADGRAFDVVKVFWRPSELQHRLEAIGWEISVRPVGEMFLFGTGTRLRR